MQLAWYCTALALILFASSIAPTRALDNGLGRTPSMGYNTWYSFFESPTEAACKDTISLLQTLGLRAAGYEYLYDCPASCIPL